MALATTVVGGWLWFGRVVSDVPVFGIEYPDPGMIMTRYETTEHVALLIKRERAVGSTNTSAYRYDTQMRTLLAAPKGSWDRAEGAVITLASTGGRSKNWTVGTQDGVVFFGGSHAPSGIVATRGKTAFHALPSPCDRLVEVLSADGKERWKLRSWFVPMGGGYTGQHYVEFFGAPDMKPLGFVRIPFTTAQGLDAPCWSEDGKYLVYASSDGKRMCVIHTDDLKKE